MVGISDFAQSQLADLTYVELPDLNAVVMVNEELVVIESVKAALEVYAPVSGRITDVNEALIQNPKLINTDPFGEGWIFKLKASDPTETDGLLDAEAYKTLVS